MSAAAIPVRSACESYAGETSTTICVKEGGDGSGNCTRTERDVKKETCRLHRRC